jgi:drug/metabolite transporter (DMT)-like permease
MPFVTVSLGAWLADEKVGSGLLLGGALVLVGVWIGAISAPSRSLGRKPAAALPAEAD